MKDEIAMMMFLALLCAMVFTMWLGELQARKRRNQPKNRLLDKWVCTCCGKRVIRRHGRGSATTFVCDRCEVMAE
jgi:hypothetical protein